MKNKLVSRMTLIALLTALCCVLRVAFVEFPNVKPITALFFAFSIYIGFYDSLAIMSLTMLLTGMLLGFSPIIIGQILVYVVLILIFKGFSKVNASPIFLSIISAILALVFGFLISLFSGLLYGFGSGGFIAYWLAGLPFDAAHALSTLIFYPIVIIILQRTKALKK
ncbi:MAG: ECF transporter S component [Lactococcus sp.]